MKKIIALLFAALLLTAQVCAAAPAQPEAEPAAIETTQKEVDPGHLVVGNPNPMRGEFFTDLWGNISSDQDVRALLHGYDLIRWDGDNGVFTNDPAVVTYVDAIAADNGDHVYTLTLARDLYYSDGTRITAWDYAFSYLLQIAPEMEELGATPAKKPAIVGYQAYVDGRAQALAGVRVLNDYTLQVTIDHAYLPFFYEMALLMCSPYPISVIAPGVAVRDNGAGIYLANIDPEKKEPVFTAELLKNTILGPNGYQSHPKVVSGPYILTSWDGETAEFTRNQHFKGNYKGEKPAIEKLTYKTSDNASMIEELKNGEYNLLNKVVNIDAIKEGLDLLADKDLGKEYAAENYDRTGMSFISFSCEKPALSEKEVRQAIAWCMDRDAVTRDYAGEYGTRVDGYYGIGQWMYGVINDKIDLSKKSEAERAALAALNLDELTAYTVDTDTAAALLEGAGWKVNEETGIREKEIDGQNVALDLTLIYPENNPAIAESFEKNFVPNLKEAGINVTLEPIRMQELLTQYYDPEAREADMIFLASNFEKVFDPSAYFTTTQDEETGAQIHTWIATGCEDEGLYSIASAMRTTKPGDVLTYEKNWIEFEKRFNEVLPMLPIYSNVYYDFFTSKLAGYDIPATMNWGEAIVSAHVETAQESVAEPRN